MTREDTTVLQFEYGSALAVLLHRFCTNSPGRPQWRGSVCRTDGPPEVVVEELGIEKVAEVRPAYAFQP